MVIVLSYVIDCFSLMNCMLLDPIIQTCTFVWEICPEHWINDDMEFLERYLN